jgi:hypothetical protein
MHEAGAEARHHRLRFGRAAGGEQEPGRLRNPAIEQNEEHACRQPDQPEDAPAEPRLQRGGKKARDDIRPRHVAADQHHQPAAMPGGDGLGQQGERDGQHPADRSAHEEAHEQVPAECGHRAADGRGDEYDAGEQDRRPPADAITQPAPPGGAKHHSNERAQRQQGHGHLTLRVQRRLQAVLLRHTGNHERQRGRLHDVDGHGDSHDGEQRHVGTPDRGLVQRRHPHPGDPIRIGPGAPRHQSIPRQRDAGDDEGHACFHRVIHRHAGQPVAHVTRTDVHGQMQRNTRAHRCDSEPEHAAMRKGDHRLAPLDRG